MRERWSSVPQWTSDENCRDVLFLESPAAAYSWSVRMWMYECVNVVVEGGHYIVAKFRNLETGTLLSICVTTPKLCPILTTPTLMADTIKRIKYTYWNHTWPCSRNKSSFFTYWELVSTIGVWINVDCLQVSAQIFRDRGPKIGTVPAKSGHLATIAIR